MILDVMALVTVCVLLVGLIAVVVCEIVDATAWVRAR